MDTEFLDVPCGYCAGCGRREIPDGAWLLAPACPDCGGTGYLVLSEGGERLLAFVQRHVGHLLRREIAMLRAELATTRAANKAAASPAM